MKKNIWERLMMEILRGQKVNESLYNLKKHLSYSDYKRCLTILSKQTDYKNILLSFCKTTCVDDLFIESPFPILTSEYKKAYIYNDILFYIAYLDVYKERVKEFIAGRVEFENFYLNGKYKEAQTVLEQVCQSCGFSFWYMESKLMLLNSSEYKEYHQYYLKLRDSCENALLKNCVRLVKRKINMRTTQRTYNHFFIGNFGKKSTDNPKDIDVRVIRHYMEYMFSEMGTVIDDEFLADLVNILYHLSIVDAFLLLEKLLLNLVAFHKDDKAKDYLYLFKNNFYEEENKRGETFEEVKKFFCTGQWDACLEKCEQALKMNASHFEIVEVYTKCIVMAEQKVKIAVAPLEKLIKVLVFCCLKEDNTDYGSNFVDFCDRYLRAYSHFSAYYELFGFVSERMYPLTGSSCNFFRLKLLCRNFHSSEEIYEKRIGFSEDNYSCCLEYTCEWNQYFREELQVHEELKPDPVLRNYMKLDYMEEYMPWQEISNAKERFVYEEYAVERFQKCLENKQYLEAIKLYIKVYFQCTFMVLRMNVNVLNEYLTSGECEKMLGEMDFFLYANLTDLHKGFRDIHSQTVIDSFAAVLYNNNIQRPSEILKYGCVPDKKILKYWEFCCSDILTESPCDLYDVDKCLEQINLLNKIINYNDNAIYKGWLLDVEQQYDYLTITDKLKNRKWITDKIVADWIRLENDVNIMNAYGDFEGKVAKQIIENDSLLGKFKEVFVNCKKDYINQVNVQMGTTIRHGILEAEFVQILKKNNLFIPECDEQEKEKLFAFNKYLKALAGNCREQIFYVMQKNCKDLFSDVDKIKREYIFFTHKHEPVKGYTSLYMTIDEMKQAMTEMGEIVDEVRFVGEIKKLLDKLLETHLPLMRTQVTEKLKTASKDFIQKTKVFLAEEQKNEDLNQLETEFDSKIDEIGRWFKLTYNGRQLYDVTEYIRLMANDYEDIEFDYLKEVSMLQLNTIRCIDLVLKNLIRNIDLHSGYSANRKDAQAKICIEKDKNLNQIKICSTNKISSDICDEEVERSVNEINMIHNMNETEQLYEGGDKHGSGYKKIGTILRNNFQTSYLSARYENRRFVINIAFDCEGRLS